MFTVRVYQDDVCVVSLPIDLPPRSQIVAVQAQASWVEPGKNGERAFYWIDRSGIHHEKLVPWHDVEQIAAWVLGDGADVQRLALADSILEGRHLP